MPVRDRWRGRQFWPLGAVVADVFSDAWLDAGRCGFGHAQTRGSRAPRRRIRSMTQDAQQTTVIGPDAEIAGEMTFGGNARVLGRFEGRIAAKGEVEIGQGARCRATIEAATVVIDGQVEGDVIARDRVRLGPNAKVTGDVTARTLAVSEGAHWIGRCNVTSDAEASAKQRPHARPTPRPAEASGDAPSEPKAGARPAWLSGARAGAPAEPSWLKRPGASEPTKDEPLTRGDASDAEPAATTARA
ncbi:MAG: hypothetical protein EA378_06080 [Phycisphaerales bacterium]|nr:MAG: hypothetical protein EA378_06080 [Phycisphaerales bacterium]